MAVQLTIKSVANKTGLSTHTIRAWERRYGALVPQRTETNRRLYDESDLERLTCLRRAVESGYGISHIARLPIEELRLLSSPDTELEAESNNFVRRCMEAVVRLDAEALDSELSLAAASMGLSETVQQVVLPVIQQLDVRWAEGTLRIAQEHLASATLRTFLETCRSGLPCSPRAPRLLVTTPSGQVHELGAVIVGLMAALQGWNVLYLGPNMPGEEIAESCRRFGADAVALSLVYPLNDPRIETEVSELRQSLGPSVPVLVGGRASASYEAALKKAAFRRVSSLRELSAELASVRAVAQR